MNRNDKLTISYGLLVDTADAIRTQLGTSGLISPEDFPTLIASISPTPPTPVRPVVPQTGTWQFKTTPTKGYLIIGKDDDPVDTAQFVRMVNGYGYPVVLNSTSNRQDVVVNSDTDTSNSQYPSGSVAHFTNNNTINDVNKYIIANNKGEVALHGGDDDQTWSSDLLMGDVLDAYYATYTSGGGQKSKADFKTAIMTKYASTDVAQGASVVQANRESLEADIDTWVYTIGSWGGAYKFVVDDIDCGSMATVHEGTQTISRAQNFMGDGVLSIGARKQSPYWIFRDSGGLLPNKIAEDCQRAYDERTCIEVFHHYYIDGTTEHWDNFKDAMDIVKSYVDAGKIQVITRKGFYDLGEFVAHPIVALSIIPDAVQYTVGDTITEANFTCKAILDDDSEVVCASDRILDISDIDTSTAGTYTVYLEYRGKKTSTTITVASSTPTEYILENASFSGESMERNNNYCSLDPSITFEAGKTYKIQFVFRAETTVMYSQHWVSFNVGSLESGWRTSETQQLPTTAGITEGTVTLTVTVTSSRTLSELLRCMGASNTTIGAWSITSCYVWVDTGE